MILYFSGTGNSEYVAKRIGKAVGDEVLDLFSRLKNRESREVYSDRPWVIVSPTYAWRIPRILEAWIKRTELSGNKKIYFVMTCGLNAGNAGKYLQELCAGKQMQYLGCMQIVMPENYIALFQTPHKEEAVKIIRRAEKRIDEAVSRIQKKLPFPPAKITPVDRLSSGPVNQVFYPLFVHAKKFYVTGDCISCEKCAKVCPMNNIRFHHGRPVWGDQCTHCMACICKCPAEAIEYGKHSKGLPRYTFPKEQFPL